jgi:hypothetical protein
MSSLFFLGATSMRAAGCIVNDYFDKDFDSKGYLIIFNKRFKELKIDLLQQEKLVLNKD